MKLPLPKYSVDGSSEQASWALRECLAHAYGSDIESQEGAGEGYEEEDEKQYELKGRGRRGWSQRHGTVRVRERKILGQAHACGLGREGGVDCTT